MKSRKPVSEKFHLRTDTFVSDTRTHSLQSDVNQYQHVSTQYSNFFSLRQLNSFSFSVYIRRYRG